MTSEPIRDPKADDLLTPQNAAFIIIDYQPVQVNSIASMDRQLLVNNIVGTAKAAVAYGLGKEDGYFEALSAGLQARRDHLAAGLERLGFGVLPAMGSYFITADFRPLGFAGDDVAFCRHITEAARVTAIPVSAFYAGPDAPSHYARFAFCKRLEVLDEALARLEAWKAGREQAGGQAGGKARVV